MPVLAPLQVAIFRHPDDRDTVPFEQAIVRAYRGGAEAGGYLATGDDLGIQTGLFSTAPLLPAAQFMDGFGHTLVVVLVDRALIDKGGAALWDWLAACRQTLDASNGRHALLMISMEERQVREVIALRPVFKSLQMSAVYHYGEQAVRPALLALRAVHECRVLLARALPHTAVMGQPSGYLRLFISHTKEDGLPLAHSLKHIVDSTPWLKGFYDADDLPTGGNWQHDLERAAASSLMVMLRTEAYDDRPWCQNEVWWADEYATPAVVVDARTGLNFRGATLPLERLPVVRIPDGNLFRVLFLALREGLRYLHFMRRVEGMKTAGELPQPVELRVFSFAPGMSALLRAARSLVAANPPTGTKCIILYPDPPLRTGVYEAAAALVATHAPAGARLLTPNTIATLANP